MSLDQALAAAAAMPAGTLALFDLDGTLLPGDSDHAFGEFVIALGWADADRHRADNNAFYQQYLAGSLDLHAYVEFSTRPWRTRSAAELAQAQRRFIDEVIAPQLLPPARALLHAHAAAGHRCVIVTATNAFVTRPVADALGVAELIAVNLQRDASGAYTGLIDGTPSFREGKIARVTQWLHAQGLDWPQLPHSIFYSDSSNDLPLLERVAEPVATNPGASLEATAQARGWRILRLFNP